VEEVHRRVTGFDNRVGRMVNFSRENADLETKKEGRGKKREVSFEEKGSMTGSLNKFPKENRV